MAQTFSPGDLAEPHKKLEGLGNCTKCHAEGQQLSPSLCLDCHTDVKKRVASHSGLHGKLSSSDREQCQNCHKEHQGVGAKLIDWGRGINQFDHNRAGYPLRGKHAAQKCQGCHETRRIVDPAIVAALAKDPQKKTWLGLGKTCTSCHFDEHRGQTSKQCESCHNEMAWKPVAKLDHNKTAFPLKGKHQGVECKSCHPQERDTESHAAFPAPVVANAFLKLKPIEHTRCLDCHEDPHKGKFSKNCESCHSVDGWTTIKRSSDREFHNKTAFPLKGQHENVACTQCHGPWPGRPAKFRGLAFKQCRDCHADAHNGQLKAACETCHDVEGFVPAKFELENHQKTAYPLDGAHGAVACTSCHLPSSSAGGSKVPVGPDGSLRASESHTRDRHTHHVKPSKRPVHPASAVVLASSAWRFHPVSDTTRCESCHQDPHAGQMAHFGDGCRHCHDTASFRTVRFDHRESGFLLTGKHVGAACNACHVESTIDGKKSVRYRPIDRACASCHRDEHAGQFKGKACETCHTTDGFLPSLFRHDNPQMTSFTLDGKHQKVACAGCHKPVVIAGSALKVTRYRPLPRACEACHEDFHHGDFRGFQP